MIPLCQFWFCSFCHQFIFWLMCGIWGWLWYISLTHHLTAAPFWVPFRTITPCFCNVMVGAVIVAVQPSSHIFPMYISAPHWSWGEMWNVLALVDSNGLRLSSTFWVAWIRRPYGRITYDPCVVISLLLQGVSTLMYFFVEPVSTIPYLGLLLGGFPLQLLQLLLFFV